MRARAIPARTRRRGSRRRDDVARRRRREAGRSAPPAPALDGGIAASAAVLAGLGVVMVYSATAPLAIGEPVPPLALRHLLGMAVAALCVAVASVVPLAVWRRLALPAWGIAILLLLLTPLVGLEANGARRWIAVPGLPVSLQPGELAKWATVLATASVLARGLERRATRGGGVVRALLLTAAPAALLLLQPDLGSAVILVTLIGLLFFAAGVPLRRLALPALAAALCALLYVTLHPYAMARVRAVADPWQLARGEGFQLVQSFVAFGRGGSFGVGLGDGRQKLFYLPEAHTDFILSVVAEELGLAGVLLVLGAFAALALAGLRVARRARDPFALLAAFGMTVLIAVPAGVNAGVVMGLLPTTGLTLPFLSFGSNSLLTTALAVGMLLRIARHEAPPQPLRVRGAAPRGLVS